ncbi:MAG: UDP-N-acetylmuramate dehydrogenase [Bacteroidia bacterium]|nr:UDP-N-acetylmuramate dehydrogenase [Bacteroidia bacterium]
MNTYQKVSLKSYNSFGISSVANKLIECQSVEEVKSSLNDIKGSKYYILGGGNNVLFADLFDGIILRPNILGISVVNEDDNFIDVKAGAGEDWDSFVAYTVDKNYGGLENLSLIPGTVGASPVQNIGAYGAEVKDTIICVEGVFVSSGEYFSLTNEECLFGYRNSIFKSKYKGDAIITHVTFRLNKHPEVNISYAPVRDAMAIRCTNTIQAVREEIINIRNNKLPDPKVTGNAGSFFKNPEVSSSVFNELKTNYPAIPSYQLTNGDVKIPAAWLIEHCGWKGKSLGRAAVHHIQPLVLINNGNATADDILKLANAIISDVKNKFGIELNMEVNYVK